jgi:hypothetical protein
LEGGVNGNDAFVGGVKKGGPALGKPVQPVGLQEPENRGAVASENCCEPLIKAVAVPGEPFRSLSTARDWPTLS